MKRPKPYWKMYVGVTAHISSGLRLAYSRLTLRPNRSGSESIVEITCGICYVGDQKHGFFVKPKMTIKECVKTTCRPDWETCKE